GGERGRHHRWERRGGRVSSWAGAGALGGEPLRVMAFGERDRRRDAPEPVVLIEQPVGVEVPPLGAVEDVVEPRPGEPRHLLRGAAQGSAKKVRPGAAPRRAARMIERQTSAGSWYAASQRKP